MDERPLRIGQLAARSGVTVRTLHLYEQRGLIKPLFRHANGYRFYDASLEKLIRVIGAALSLGLSLAEIGDIFEPVRPLQHRPTHDEARICVERARDVYLHHIALLDARIGKLESQRELLEASVNDCVNELKGTATPSLDVPAGLRRRNVPGRVEYVQG